MTAIDAIIVGSARGAQVPIYICAELLEQYIACEQMRTTHMCTIEKMDYAR